MHIKNTLGQKKNIFVLKNAMQNGEKNSVKILEFADTAKKILNVKKEDE